MNLCHLFIAESHLSEQLVKWMLQNMVVVGALLSPRLRCWRLLASASTVTQADDQLYSRQHLHNKHIQYSLIEGSEMEFSFIIIVLVQTELGKIILLCKK